MAGRISDADIALVRERSPIESVVGEYVTLKSAGGGNVKGLCPFHEEKTPSFNVTPIRGLYNCFGCQVGGDTIDFVMRIEHLGFTEAIEKLAARAGVTLRYEEAGSGRTATTAGRRSRIVAANDAALAFFRRAYASDAAAEVARTFLAERGFDAAVVEAYDVGWAPDSWEALTGALTKAGFTREELIAAGLTVASERGGRDRFRGRLIFPIRSASNEVVGFGARKMLDADTGPKYLNTPETEVFKKGHLLYGLDKAGRAIGDRRQVVVVEGYTDVMACHLAGVATAVATCGTSLTDDHVQLLRRRLMDSDGARGEVIFTFDGDDAGQRAALKVFEKDAEFVTQTFVAVEPGGLDPCELRLAKGDAAVRDLVARRVPMYEFKLRAVLGGYDLDSAEGRVRALAVAAPIVAAIRDQSLRPEYARRLAGWLGLPESEVTGAVARRPGRDGSPSTSLRPAASDPLVAVEREALKSVLQHPQVVGPVWDTLDAELFTEPRYAACHAAIEAAGGVASVGPDETAVAGFLARVREAAPDDEVRSLVTALAVEPMPATDAGRPGYVVQQVARIQEIGVTRRIVERKGRLQRLNPVEQPDVYNALFAEVIELQARQRALRAQALGDPAS